MSNIAQTIMGDIMQDDFKETKKNSSFLLQRCVKVEEFYDYEFSTEFYFLAPVDVNDLYNQN